MGTKALVGPHEGTVTGYFQAPAPSPSLAACPLWKDTCLPAAQPQPSRGKCRVSSCYSHGCLGVFTRVTVRVCLDGASGGAGFPGLASYWGRAWERVAGWLSGFPLMEPSRPRLHCHRRPRPGEAEGHGLGSGRPCPHHTGQTRLMPQDDRALSCRRGLHLPLAPGPGPRVGRNLAASFPWISSHSQTWKSPCPSDGPSHLCPSRGPQRVGCCPFTLASDTQNRRPGWHTSDPPLPAVTLLAKLPMSIADPALLGPEPPPGLAAQPLELFSPV